MRPSSVLFTVFALFAASVAVSAACSTTCPSKAGTYETYSTAAVSLSTAIEYSVTHKTDSTYLYLKLQAKYDGWLGFGFGEEDSGSMKGADLVTVQIVGTEVFVQDRYCLFAPTSISSSGTVTLPSLSAPEDTTQDWIILSGQRVNGVMVVEMKRKLNTGDTQDRIIADGEHPILWAYGPGNTPAYHGGNRGTGQIIFRTTTNAANTVPASNTAVIAGATAYYSLGFTAYNVPASTTVYACKAFDLTAAPYNSANAAKYIVGWRVVVPDATKAYVHHLTVHVCKNNSYFSQSKTQGVCSNFESGCGAGCSPQGQSNAQCNSLLYAWAKGQTDFLLPTQAHFPIGPGTVNNYLIVEVHYDNPFAKTDISDSVEVQAHYTTTARSFAAAGMVLGDPSVKKPAIPKATQSTHVQATCPAACTNKFTSEITVFADFMHMHLYGEKMWTELYRGATSTYEKTTTRIDFWDNGFQKSNGLSYTVKPGDYLQTHCYYNTQLQTSSDVNFGTSTKDEMCMHFLFYYPALYLGVDSTGASLPFAWCGSYVNSGTDMTVCGSAFQTSSAAFMAGGQVSQLASTYVDPAKFGVATSGTSAAKCCVASTSTASPASKIAPKSSLFDVALCALALATVLAL